MVALFWLPHDPDWQAKAGAVAALPDQDTWPALVALANKNIGFAETLRLDRMLQRYAGAAPPEGLATKPVKLAILSSSTSEHLLPGLRVGALRHGLWLSVYTTAYGQYLQELLDPQSGLHAFQPTAILCAFDPAHLFADHTIAMDKAVADQLLDAVTARLQDIWRRAKQLFGCEIYQQTLLPSSPHLAGSNEHRLPGSLASLCRRMNERLRDVSDAAAVHLVALDDQVSQSGLNAWFDPVYWHKAKQEITPSATPMYGEIVARLLAAAQGRARKCLVLDLDNTLWGGVIGDDGLEGIKLGQGSATGEAYLALQRYALQLSERGIILAVCSKNDEANARSPFERHPEMLLTSAHIASFVANWNDKAANLRRIATELNIGLDALVFVDDNPFERNIVRQELPMVAVPELPDDPALYVATLAAAGYFESLRLTPEDFARAQQYQANTQREILRTSSTDLVGYLKSLKMELHASAFDRVNLSRIVQLINKTNQFNLTTRRYSEAAIVALMADPQAFTLQLRLTDQFGDNGIIGIVIGLLQPDSAVLIDTWLMSCRVLGRGVEEATLNLVVKAALQLKAKRLIGQYIPTAKNAMVRDHYLKLGFTQTRGVGNEGTDWALDVQAFEPLNNCIVINEAA